MASPTMPTTVDERSPTLMGFLQNCPSLRQSILDLPETLTLMHPRDMERRIRKLNSGVFDRTLAFVKIQFWDEYKRSFKSGKPMLMQNILHGICSAEWFQKHIQRNSLYLAYLVSPPVEEIIWQKEIRAKTLQKMSEALDAPLYDTYSVMKIQKDGTKNQVLRKKLNVQLLKEVHAIFKSMSDRIDGSVIQRQQIESKNLHVEGTKQDLLDPSLTLEQLEAFQKKLAQTKLELEQIVEIEAPDGGQERSPEGEGSSGDGSDQAATDG